MDKSEKSQRPGADADPMEREVVDIEAEDEIDVDDGAEAGDGEKEEPRETVDPRVTYIRDLERRLREKQATLGEYIAAYKQLEQDKESFKVRLEREKDKELSILRGRLVEDLIELMDNLDRSVYASQGSKNYDGLAMGIKMVLHQFDEKLAKLGVSQVPTVGQPFDPNLHEAVDVALAPSAEGDGAVLLEYSRGYRMGERIIRPARVRVGRYDG